MKAEHHTTSLRLWQLISPSLPVGSYAYSQGLESACEAAWVHDQHSACQWIEQLMQYSLCQVDVPVLKRLYEHWKNHDSTQSVKDSPLYYWNHTILACRESMEIKKEDLQLGHSLKRLLLDLGELPEDLWPENQSSAYVTWFAYACVRWQIPLEQAAQGYVWSWCENQVAAAIKLVPLGQTAGQNILSQLGTCIPMAVAQGLQLSDTNIGATLPGLAIGSAWHENQYSRLFRS